MAIDGDGEIIGFARVSSYSDRCVASASTASTSPAAASEQAGLYKLTSRVFVDNAASRAVHLAAGFTEVGIQRRHGRLDGEWRDCVLVERLLGEATI